MTDSRQFKKRCAGCMADKQSERGCPFCHWDDAAFPEVHNHMPRHYILDGRYYVGRVLGQGGFGITYLAFDERLKRRMAIKEYFPSSMCSRHTNRVTIQSSVGGTREPYLYGLKQFLGEARILAQFEGHPLIVGVNEFLEANGTGYMVMGYLEGMTLRAALAQQPDGRMAWDLAIQTLTPVMEALKEVHMHNLMHRDVSPDNIFITNRMQVKLIDFGAARHAVGEFSQSLSVILKPGYAPEEQYRSNGGQGPWTDVYALAATLYRTVTGQLPPPSPDRLADDRLAVPSSLCPGITPDQDRVLLKAMAVKAQNRYQTVDEFQTALAPSFGVVPPPPPPPPGPQPWTPPPSPGAQPWTPPAPIAPVQQRSGMPVEWIVGLAAVALILILGVLYWIDRERDSGARVQPPPVAGDDGFGPKPAPNEPPTTAASVLTAPSEPPGPPGGVFVPPPKPQQDTDGWKSFEDKMDVEARAYQGDIATIHVANQCMQTPVRIAVRYLSAMSGSYVTVGWRTVAPGQTLNTHLFTKKEKVYFFAEGTKKQLEWNGSTDEDASEVPVVSDTAFAHPDGTIIDGSGKRYVKMFSRKITEVGNYTVTLTCGN